MKALKQAGPPGAEEAAASPRGVEAATAAPNNESQLLQAYHFVFDRAANSQQLKSMTVIDENTKECLTFTRTVRFILGRSSPTSADL